MTERNDRLLATVRKNAREEIRITRGDFKGFDVVGVRVWRAILPGGGKGWRKVKARDVGPSPCSVSRRSRASAGVGVSTR